jgi:hypothetical protein
LPHLNLPHLVIHKNRIFGQCSQEGSTMHDSKSYFSEPMNQSYSDLSTRCLTLKRPFQTFPV